MKKIIKKVSLFTLIVFSIVCLCACGNSKSIVGTWEYENNEATYYIFNKDNTGSYTYAGDTDKFTYEDRGTKVVITYVDTLKSDEIDYSISKNKLTIKSSTGSDIVFKRK